MDLVAAHWGVDQQMALCGFLLRNSHVDDVIALPISASEATFPQRILSAKRILFCAPVWDAATLRRLFPKPDIVVITSAADAYPPPMKCIEWAAFIEMALEGLDWRERALLSPIRSRSEQCVYEGFVFNLFTDFTLAVRSYSKRDWARAETVGERIYEHKRAYAAEVVERNGAQCTVGGLPATLIYRADFSEPLLVEVAAGATGIGVAITLIPKSQTTHIALCTPSNPSPPIYTTFLELGIGAGSRGNAWAVLDGLHAFDGSCDLLEWVKSLYSESAMS